VQSDTAVQDEVQSERNRDTVQPERNTEAMVKVEAELNDDSKEHPKATEPNVEEIGRERTVGAEVNGEQMDQVEPNIEHHDDDDIQSECAGATQDPENTTADGTSVMSMYK
jgi:hypothetical protein